MSIVYVTEQRSRIHKKGERILVSRDGQVLREIPVGTVEQVHIMGRGVSVTTPALAVLAQHNVQLVYLTQRGRFLASVNGPLHKHGALRVKQAHLVDNKGLTLPIAKQIVIGKLTNQRALLLQLRSRAPKQITGAVKGIEEMAKRVPKASDYDMLLGFEGRGAVAYWEGFRALLREEWGFKKRAYYPPPDPINALLSFGYTLLRMDVQGAVRAIGLDPYLGVLHVIDYGRPSLALDLMEEWRPIIVDAMVLGLVNSGQITSQDFALVSKGNSDKPGVYLVDDARKLFLRAYQERVNERAFYRPTEKRETFQRMFQLQAQLLARVMLADGQMSYQAYTG